MLYFIPSWYKLNNVWSENEQSWYLRREKTEFDDTVKQVQLFHRSKAYPYRILLLGFTPNLRHFLHRQGVYMAPYWSVFDAIQEVRRKRARVLTFHNLNWPKDVEFIYTSFMIMAYLNGEKYAEIDFGEDGNPIRIDIFENGMLQRRNIYDDRGFVGSTILYKDGKEDFQDYLDEDGMWKIRHYFDDGHVEVNPKFNEYLIQIGKFEKRKKFLHLTYKSLDDVIREVFQVFVRFTSKDDIFCIAAHDRHMPVINKVLMNHKTIFSFFEDRYNVSKHPEIKSLLEDANYIITDSFEKSEIISDVLGLSHNRIKDITPYDSRVDFGISMQLNVQKILVPIDGLDEDIFVQLIVALAGYLKTNSRARVHLLTRRSDYNKKDMILQITQDALRMAGLNPDMARAEQDDEENPILFFAEQCVDELSVSRCFREQRIIIDMRDIPDLYLQILAISTGIPQIVRFATQYIKTGENGFAIDSLEDLNDKLDYYLGSVQNWNNALIASHEIGKNYTTRVLLDSWKEVINSIE